MLVQLSNCVQDCYRRATEAHNRAAMTDDSEYKRFLLDMKSAGLGSLSQCSFRSLSPSLRKMD
jgi:hypothetical protein